MNAAYNAGIAIAGTITGAAVAWKVAEPGAVMVITIVLAAVFGFLAAMMEGLKSPTSDGGCYS